MQLAGPLAWLVIGAGTLGLWAGSGAFVDGIHHAIHTLGAPPLLGQSAALQAVLHALAPTLLLGALATLGAAGAALFTGSPGADAAVVLLVPVLLVPVLVAGRGRGRSEGRRGGEGVCPR